MFKKNMSNSIKLIQYYKLINHNLIFNNKAINRYKKDNFEIIILGYSIYEKDDLGIIIFRHPFL